MILLAERDEQTNQTNRPRNCQKDGEKDVQIKKHTDGQANEQTFGQINRAIDRHMDI
jgi:hypothetical protein